MVEDDHAVRMARRLEQLAIETRRLHSLSR
jgi:hypothetical protein